MTQSHRCTRRSLLLVMIGLTFAAATVYAAEELTLTLTIRDHHFEPSELKAPAGTKIKLVVTNADRTPEEFESYDLNREKLIRPGQTVTIHLPALKPGSYEFFGEFHPKTAQGLLVVE